MMRLRTSGGSRREIIPRDHLLEPMLSAICRCDKYASRRLKIFNLGCKRYLVLFLCPYLLLTWGSMIKAHLLLHQNRCMKHVEDGMRACYAQVLYGPLFSVCLFKLVISLELTPKGAIIWLAIVYVKGVKLASN